MYPGIAVWGLCSWQCVKAWHVDKRAVPPPDIIAARAAEVRAGWSEAETAKRLRQSAVPDFNDGTTNDKRFGEHLLDVAPDVARIRAQRAAERARVRRTTASTSSTPPATWMPQTASTRGMAGPLADMVKARMRLHD